MYYRILTLALLCCLQWINLEAKQVSFSFNRQSITDNALLVKHMEENLSKLLTEIDNANQSNRKLKYTGIDIDNTAIQSLDNTWSILHFGIDNANIQTKCLHMVNGFQARLIFITLNPVDDSFIGDLNRELAVDFSKEGRINSVHMAYDTELVSGNFKGQKVEDDRRLMEIMDFVEKFRNYYIEKNIVELEKIYAEDALIITGTVLNTPDKNTLKKESPKINVYYRTEHKVEYINRLKNQIFKNNRYINVEFTDVYIEQGRTEATRNFYGVKLHQDWATVRNSAQDPSRPTYEDHGWLFLLWEFPNDGGSPTIHVRTWQPDESIKSDDDVINMHDIDYQSSKI